MMNTSIVIVGVGGQGTLLASRILGALAAEMNLPVKVSEVHGMAQRGGNVITHVRIGEGIHSPLIEPGGADYLLAFEQLEALRALPYLKKDGTLIVNTQKIAPMPVITGVSQYPEDILIKLSQSRRTAAMDALALARDAGDARAVNLVLLGALCRLMGTDRALWQKAIENSVPEKFRSINHTAFDLGYEEVLKA
jgi:indolepyruvate ferredoxin oxidoreductase, beta subunit